jgi:hypothetical protein
MSMGSEDMAEEIMPYLRMDQLPFSVFMRRRLACPAALLRGAPPQF